MRRTGRVSRGGSARPQDCLISRPRAKPPRSQRQRAGWVKVGWGGRERGRNRIWPIWSPPSQSLHPLGNWAVRQGPASTDEPVKAGKRMLPPPADQQHWRVLRGGESGLGVAAVQPAGVKLTDGHGGLGAGERRTRVRGTEGASAGCESLQPPRVRSSPRPRLR